MRRFSTVAVLTVLLSASSAQAMWLDFPSREGARSRIVKLLKKFITIVDGDAMSEPKP